MIEISNLGHRFDSTVAIDDISLTINPGEWVVITGRNGSGKTTLIRHFNGLLTPDSGTVRIDGIEPESDPVTARTKIGMVFQFPADQFVAATVEADIAFGPENLGLAQDEIDRRVRRALTAVGMENREEARIDFLSGGEQARIAIAGALAMEPDYLVLDEPFAQLDWPARQSVLEHLDAIAANGTTIVLVTHDLRDLLDRADRIVGLRNGTVAFVSEPTRATNHLEGVGVRIPEC